MANCMIHSKNMSSSFWAEEVNCANYIQNWMPHKAVLHMTPEEAWSHVKPDVSIFRVFGCAAWAIIPHEKHKAMEKKSQPLIFVGYCEDMKGYRLFDPVTKDVLFRRAVRFDEHFKHSSDLSLSIDWQVGANHANSLVFEDQEVMRITLLKMEINQNCIHLLQLNNLLKNRKGEAFVKGRHLKGLAMMHPISVIFLLLSAIISQK